MKLFKYILILGLVLSCRESAITEFQSRVGDKGNVILLTLDGVRYEEFFNKDIFRTFWDEHASKGIVLGDPKKKSRARIANTVMLSLPGYKTMHEGSRVWCRTNKCGPSKKETLGEKLKRVKSWNNHEVGIISSWGKICDAAMRKERSLFHSCGDMKVKLPGHFYLNEMQEADTPIWGGRYDKYTFEHGMKFIEDKKPRFLHLSLLDSDEYAHDDEWDGYMRSLYNYDLYIDRLYTLLDQMGEYGKNTTVIITTDHGRGKGDKWTGHFFNWNSRKIWMVVKGPHVPARGSISHKRKITHLHIRPFTELMLGIKEIKGKHRILDLILD
ncbi:MAG: sulfatase-like hydrolase/transferase [Bacteriovoracaceae bacterium]|nr:sulfatase-like hydrolase/transferase [Bacteriovoracaceae bacterium]